MRKVLALVVSNFIFLVAAAQQANDTFHVYFNLNVPELNKQAREYIDSLVYNDRILPGRSVLIVGYADYLGTERLNKPLSEARANNVRDYLAAYAIDKKDIKLCIGRGQVNRSGARSADGYPKDRKVDIVIEKANLHVKSQNAAPHKNVKSSLSPIVKNYKNDVSDIAIYNPGQSYVLRNIYFLPERHTITPRSIPELEKLYDVLEGHPALRIRIEGHVCCIRDYPDAMDIENGDLNLSVNRAKAIYDYLIEKGIDTSRLRFIGYGKSKPIVRDEANEEDANKNRRVEIRVLTQ